MIAGRPHSLPVVATQRRLGGHLPAQDAQLAARRERREADKRQRERREWVWLMEGNGCSVGRK